MEKNIYKKSFENMDEGIKKYLEFIDKSELEKIRLQFSNYLARIKLDNKTDYGKIIDWSIILGIFDNEVNKLVKKFEVPRNIEESKETLEIFRIELLNHLKPNIFKSMIDFIESDDKNTSSNDFNKKMGERFNVLIPAFFRVFDMQFQLTSLNPNNDSKSILLDVEKTRRYKTAVDKFIGKKHRSFELRAFKKVIELYREQKDNGFDISYRKLAIKVAREDLELLHEREQNNFYKRFTEWNKKKK